MFRVLIQIFKNPMFSHLKSRRFPLFDHCRLKEKALVQISLLCRIYIVFSKFSFLQIRLLLLLFFIRQIRLKLRAVNKFDQ